MVQLNLGINIFLVHYIILSLQKKDRQVLHKLYEQIY